MCFEVFLHPWTSLNDSLNSCDPAKQRRELRTTHATKDNLKEYFEIRTNAEFKNDMWNCQSVKFNDLKQNGGRVSYLG